MLAVHPGTDHQMNTPLFVCLFVNRIMNQVEKDVHDEDANKLHSILGATISLNLNHEVQSLPIFLVQPSSSEKCQFETGIFFQNIQTKKNYECSVVYRLIQCVKNTNYLVNPNPL